MSGPSLIGRTLSHYRILSKLGQGGMGEVFLAEDTELGRQVALKVLDAEVAADPERSERFRREAKAVAALNHPNIVTIHSIEETDGVRFLTMERIDGESLDRTLPVDGLPLARLFELAIPLADALAAAHAQGIVHRDLKPANVMVTKDGRVKVLDFGLAKLSEDAEPPKPADLAQGATRSVPLTGAGVLLGTVPYMSPEQLEGKPVDHRSDIFSLGIVLYELATGTRPFRGESAIALASSIVRDAPRPISELRVDAPRQLSRIIDHCLTKDPEDRFQSTKDLRNELRALREEWKSETVPAADGSVRSRADAPAPGSTRAPTLLRWIGLGAALLVLAAAGLWLTARNGEPVASVADSGPKRIAVLPFENLGAAEDSYFAEGMTEQVRGKLAGLSGLAVIARASAEQYRGSKKGLEEIAKELGVRFLLTGTVRWQKGGAQDRIQLTPELVELSGRGAPTTRWQEPFEAELSDVFRVQGEIATQVARSLEVALSGKERGQLEAPPTSNVAAYDAYLRGQKIESGGLSPATLRQAAAQYEQAVALDAGFALAWARLSASRSELVRLTLSTPKAAEAAKNAAERALELDPDLAQAYGALGDYHLKIAGEPEKALAAYEQGLKIAPDDARLLRAFAGGVASRSPEKLDESLALMRRARDLDPRSWESERVLGQALVSARRSREAREAYDRGLALAPANLTLIHRKVQTYLQEGDLAAARAVLAAAQKEVETTTLVAFVANYGDLDWVLDDAQRDLLLRLTPAAFDDDQGVWAIVLAQAFSRRGQEERVRFYAARAVQDLAAPLKEAPETAQQRIFLGLALAYLGRKEEAVREGERGLALIPSNRYFQHQLVRIHILAGDHERALDLLTPLLKLPYFLTPGWLRIDPNFDPLRGNPRFEQLARGA